MTGKLKGIIVIVSLGMLIYLVSSADFLVAEDSENEAREQFAGAMISVEASIVIVEPEVLEEITDDLNIQNLNSIPLEKIMQIIREDEGGEMISAIKLAVGNNSEAEMNSEDNVEEKRKIFKEETGEQERRESVFSFRITPEIIDLDKIAVNYRFQQTVQEIILSSTSEAEEEKNIVRNFEVSSEVILRPGQPRIVGATKKDEVIFLIMGVDI